jgi:adenine-specific DNA-methyltransferase
MIKYIGSKRALLPWIGDVVDEIAATAPVGKVADLFSGSARVGHALKARGYQVHGNDINAYAHVLATALVAADANTYPAERVKPILARLEALPPEPGYFTRTFCEESRFFQPHNGARIDAIRRGIEVEAAGDPTLKAVLLTSLMRAADKVDSTTGLHMAYLKQWAPRASKDLKLDYPQLLPGGGRATRGDAIEVAVTSAADLTYLDPPYNSHSYLGNYHIWETLVLDDSPATFGVARKRVDCRERRSRFNSRVEAGAAMRELVKAVSSPHVVCSFNDEGYFTTDQIEALLGENRFVTRLERPHRRYVGARIGIHNPRGEKVGRVTHTTNREYLFVATTSRAVQAALQARPEAAQPRLRT